MKVILFAVFCLVIFLTTLQAMNAPLAYFAFIPFGFLMSYYLYSLKDWFFFGLSSILLTCSYFFAAQGEPFQETASLIGTLAAAFALLAYYQYLFEVTLREESLGCKLSSEELEDLKRKHSTRVESLHHLEKQVASLINLFEIARDFNECLDLKETVNILHKKVMTEIAFERAELILLKPDPKSQTISRAYTIEQRGVQERTEISEEDPAREWVEKSLRKKGFFTEGIYWFFPLVFEGEFNALFVIEGAVKEDLAKFEVLASQLALQVRKVRLYEMVRELSIIDGLTGAFVRRHFLERFDEEIRRAIKQGFPLSVLMLDIDHFKRYNDEFGHLVGDATLRDVTQVIRANVRNVDIVARYGGEEFSVVIPETREEGALEVAERIRSAVARKAFRVYDEETRVTVSIGVSVFPQDLLPSLQNAYDPNILFELLQRADRALYRAKEEGRNRVVAYRFLGE